MRAGAEPTEEGGEGIRLGPVERVASIDSTNAELLRRAGSGAPAGAVLVADEQTSGRGRLDRTWEAAPGSSLLVSVLLRPAGLTPADAHLATVAAALAAAEACDTTAGVHAGIKWPNDLVVGDRKVAGLLAETVVTAGRLDALVVGMGLNIHWPDPMPGELAATATSLNLEAPPERVPDRDGVLAAWLAAFERQLADLATVAGRRALADRHRAACVTLGRRVRVEHGSTSGASAGGVVEGVATDLTDDGCLVVDDGVTRHVIAVGDVVHLRAAG